ncbi:MAG: class I SAM-dependent methyltransferase [Candidatus Bathyarchaeum sp.]|nr:MAG: class I SAM-dependent methyltransferase [Candidatus Bathyarchaeum sp.]
MIRKKVLLGTLKVRHKIVELLAPRLWKNMQTVASRPMIDFLAYKFHQKLIGVEIGVYAGVNALRILSKLSIERLYLVDPYVPYIYRDGIFVTAGKEALARKRLRKFEAKTTFLIEKSEDAFPKIPNNLDFVYIDGDHSYEAVKQDIQNYFPKIKPGGIIGGHDFSAECLGVPIAVLEFVGNMNLKLYGKNLDWWVVKKEENES